MNFPSQCLYDASFSNIRLIDSTTLTLKFPSLDLVPPGARHLEENVRLPAQLFQRRSDRQNYVGDELVVICDADPPPSLQMITAIISCIGKKCSNNYEKITKIPRYHHLC